MSATPSQKSIATPERITARPDLASMERVLGEFGLVSVVLTKDELTTMLACALQQSFLAMTMRRKYPEDQGYATQHRLALNLTDKLRAALDEAL